MIEQIDVCHSLWLFYDGGSLYYVIQPIYDHLCVFSGLFIIEFTTLHPHDFPKMVIRLNYLKFLCYTYNV